MNLSCLITQIHNLNRLYVFYIYWSALSMIYRIMSNSQPAQEDDCMSSILVSRLIRAMQPTRSYLRWSDDLHKMFVEAVAYHGGPYGKTVCYSLLDLKILVDGTDAMLLLKKTDAVLYICCNLQKLNQLQWRRQCKLWVSQALRPTTSRVTSRYPPAMLQSFLSDILIILSLYYHSRSAAQDLDASWLFVLLISFVFQKYRESFSSGVGSLHDHDLLRTTSPSKEALDLYGCLRKLDCGIHMLHGIFSLSKRYSAACHKLLWNMLQLAVYIHLWI